MSVELGSTTANPTGNNALSLNGAFTPTLIEFWIGPRSGTTETSNIASIGCVDITNAVATWQSNLSDATHQQTKNGSGSSTGSSCLQHYAIVAGAITKVVDIKFVSAASGTFTINILTANSSYVIFFRAFS